jgi:hypothetical protein
MAGFEKTKLATGEFRGEFIARRLSEGATVAEVHGEINAAGLYSGPEGKSWPASVVYAEKRKVTPVPKPRTARVAAIEEDEPALDLSTVEVPPEYEGVLDAADVAEVRKEAAEALRAKQRKQARKDLLAKATVELEHAAKLAAQRGTARGDMVDLTIDLAPYTPDIKLDGVSYPHGKVVRVPRKVYNTLIEIQQRTWQHEGTLHGANDRPYRRTLAERGLTANNATQALVRA